MRTFLTLDYELFMGDVCGSIQNCLITPVNKLLDVLNKYNIKATFFVDSSLLYRMNELRPQYRSLQKEWELLTENIRLLHNSGHDVELHIHPQWYFSNYNGISWIMDLDHFKLSDMNRNEVDDYVRKSQELLESLIEKKTIAFRAGGYSIQDLKDYQDFYRLRHLSIDSSVLSGLKFFSENQWYDYTSIPNKSHYRFGSDITKEEVDGGVIEVPITTKYISKTSYFLHQIYKKKNARLLQRWGDGKAIIPAHYNNYTRIKKVLARDNYIMASFDDAGGRWIKNIFDKQLLEDKDLVIISHPKLLTPYSFTKMDEFFSYAVGKTKFMTMADLEK